MNAPNSEMISYRESLRARIAALDDLTRFPGGDRLLVLTTKPESANVALCQNGRMLANLHQGLWMVNGLQLAKQKLASDPYLFALGVSIEPLKTYAERAKKNLLKILENTR